ncbi:erm Leader peptide [Staphylococcus xylosus]|nr:erm Leader peptide [Staphylococcus xylosus]PTI48864.1 erm Leader peptide [Staphylococcus xylosus]
MPFGSVIAILCAIFVIFLIPYFEDKYKKT